jgi:hypothetical protein
VYAGAYAARATASGTARAFASKTLPSTYTELYGRIRFRVTSLGSTVNLLRFQTATGTNLLTPFVSSSGNLMLRNDVQGATLSSTTKVTLNVWHELQVRVRIAGTSGQTEVWYDGVRQSSLSQTPNLGTTAVGRLILGDNVQGRTFDVAFDEVAVSTGFII